MKNSKTSNERMTAFSLVELMICTVMVSIITVALSTALFHTKQKTESYATNLTSTQDIHAILRQIARHCRQAIKMERVSGGKFTITTSNSPLQTITYHHTIDDSLTIKKKDDPTSSLLLTSVTRLSLEADTITQDSTEHLCNLTILLIYQNQTYTHTLSLLNQPEWVGQKTHNVSSPYY